jgi:hypothetical protein
MALDYSYPIDDAIILLQTIQNSIGNTAEVHGFWEDNNIDRFLLLAVGELVEAQNELRSGKDPKDIYYEDTPTGSKPCGFGVELADTIIRCFDLGARLKIDLASLIIQKMEYNISRPIKHDKQF